MIERYKLTKKVGILGIIGNLFLFVIKIIIGYISNSMSMIGDAINSAGDVFASFMTWLGNKISSVPNDSDHNYGHGKAEYIFSLLIGISMMIVSVKLSEEVVDPDDIEMLEDLIVAATNEALRQMESESSQVMESLTGGLGLGGGLPF